MQKEINNKSEYIDNSIRKKIWNVQLELLKQLLEACRINKIECFVIWGTLLGAVRHKGFIPWDDDLDVAMSRENYNKLCRIASGTFAFPYFFQTCHTDKEFFFSYARLRNSNTTGIIRDFSSPNYNCGIFIDIYPLDCIPADKKQKWIQRKMVDISAALARAKTGHRNKNIKSLLLKIIGSVFSYDYLCQVNEYWCSKYNYAGEKVGLIFNRNLLNTYQFDKRLMYEITELEFENILVPAPAYYEEILTQVYGDYMTLPPEDKRGNWHENQLIYDPDVPYLQFFKNAYVERNN